MSTLTPAGPVPARDAASSAELFGHRRGWLVGNLPVAMQEDPFLARFVTIFEELASVTRGAVEGVDLVADVTVTPPAVVRHLGSWVGAPALHERLPVDVQRRIVQAAGATLRWRGTAYALGTLLAAVTGGWVDVDDPGTVVREGDGPRVPVPVVVRLEHCGHLREDDLVALVRAEVPAHVPVVVLVAGEMVWPVPGDAPRDGAVVTPTTDDGQVTP